MNAGDLVHLVPYNPHSCEPMPKKVGIFLDMRPSPQSGAGWIVLVDGEIETFTHTYWKCSKVETDIIHE